MALTAHDLPPSRPAGLRLTSVQLDWFRLDGQPAADWSWTPFPHPRNRFDPLGGAARVRYAARTERGAFRERYAELRRRIPEQDGGVHLARLTGRIRVLDLRAEHTLDLLHLDEEISTGRDPRVLHAAAVLSARVLDWYGRRLHGLVYRSRSTPQTSANLAFFRWAPLATADLGPLADRRRLLAELIADDGFRVELPGWW